MQFRRSKQISPNKTDGRCFTIVASPLTVFMGRTDTIFSNATKKNAPQVSFLLKNEKADVEGVSVFDLSSSHENACFFANKYARLHCCNASNPCSRGCFILFTSSFGGWRFRFKGRPRRSFGQFAPPSKVKREKSHRHLHTPTWSRFEVFLFLLSWRWEAIFLRISRH